MTSTKSFKYILLILALAVSASGQMPGETKPIPGVLTSTIQKVNTPVYISYTNARVPDFAVISLNYQLGASFFGGSYQEVADIADLVCTPEAATALLKTFTELGYKWTLGSLTGTVIAIEYPDSRKEFQFWSGPTYAGNVQQYLIASYVNGVGAPGGWSKGPYGPVWTSAK